MRVMYTHLVTDRMHRTQVYLSTALNSALDDLARAQGTTKAALIRRAAQRLVDEEAPVDDDPIWGIVGMGRSGHGNVSEEHDRILVEDEMAHWNR
jgi:hypothetical protein